MISGHGVFHKGKLIMFFSIGGKDNVEQFSLALATAFQSTLDVRSLEVKPVKVSVSEL